MDGKQIKNQVNYTMPSTASTYLDRQTDRQTERKTYIHLIKRGVNSKLVTADRERQTERRLHRQRKTHRLTESKTERD